MEPYLHLGDQHLSGAEWSVPVNTRRWSRYLTGIPDVETAVVDGKISRTALLSLADHARLHPSSEASLTLFFNVLAWGIAGNWRNVSRITTVAADTPRIVDLLVEAAAAYTGDPRTAYMVVAGQIPSWGPAFFTNDLHFTSDTTPGTAKVHL